MAKFTQPTMIFDGSSAFYKITSFDSSVYLRGNTAITAPSSGSDDYALVVSASGSTVQINSRQLGSMAWETASAYISDASLNPSYFVWNGAYLDVSGGGDVTQAYVDASLAARDASITYNLNQVKQLDASIVRIDARLDASLQNYVLKTGDTMTGDLIVPGISITNDLSVGNNLVVTNDLTIGGDLFVDGSLFVRSVETVDVSSAFIFLNTGATSSPPSTMQSGIIIDRGDVSLSYVIIYDESNQSLRIGFANLESGSVPDASTQSVATREDTPLSGGIAVWNSTLKRFDTSTAGTLNVENGLQVSGASFLSDLSIGISWGGTGAAETVARSDHDHNNTYYGIITDATGETGHSVIADADTSTAYFRYIKAGSGASISSDASAITIGVTGVEGYVQKYQGAFVPGVSPAVDGSMIFYQSEHGLSAGVPYSVVIWEQTGSEMEEVYTNIRYNTSGDIIITWTPGSITGDCSVFISG